MSNFKKNYLDAYCILFYKMVGIFLIFMAFSCNEKPQWRKENTFTNLDILIKEAQLYHIAKYHSGSGNKLEFYDHSASSSTEGIATLSFIESCKRNGVISVTFDDNYQSSFWIFKITPILNCHEGIIISSSADIEEYCQNLPRPLRLKQIKPGYYWYTNFHTRGNFAEDLFTNQVYSVFPFDY